MVMDLSFKIIRMIPLTLKCNTVKFSLGTSILMESTQLILTVMYCHLALQVMARTPIQFQLVLGLLLRTD